MVVYSLISLGADLQSGGYLIKDTGIFMPEKKYMGFPQPWRGGSSVERVSWGALVLREWEVEEGRKQSKTHSATKPSMVSVEHTTLHK